MSWQDGYECYSTSDIDEIAPSSTQDHPLLILLAHDGDNAFGGGYSYYQQCVSSFVNEAQGKVNLYIYKLMLSSHLGLVTILFMQGYTATTVQQYLSQFPVDKNDVVHVEDGGWVNPDGDFGSPQSLNWNWPLIPNNARVRVWFSLIAAMLS